MTKTANTQSLVSEKPAYAEHQRWGGTYLIVADGSEEFSVALCYAVRMANENKCRVGIVYVMENQGFLHWGNIEKRMLDEQRAEAEAMINKACIDVEDRGGALPAVYIEQGGRTDALMSVIENDENVSMLILAAGTQGNNPCPLVSHFTGKGLSKLRVPVMVVPDHQDL